MVGRYYNTCVTVRILSILWYGHKRRYIYPKKSTCPTSYSYWCDHFLVGLGRGKVHDLAEDIFSFMDLPGLPLSRELPSWNPNFGWNQMSFWWTRQVGLLETGSLGPWGITPARIHQGVWATSSAPRPAAGPASLGELLTFLLLKIGIIPWENLRLSYSM